MELAEELAQARRQVEQHRQTAERRLKERDAAVKDLATLQAAARAYLAADGGPESEIGRLAAALAALLPPEAPHG